MKKIIFLFIILFSISSFGYAQTADELFSAAENIKIKKGEQSKDYLEALSAAIQQAFDEGDAYRAYVNREKHSEIVKKKYGENSLEYAGDLVRLGNVAYILGDTLNSLNRFTQAADIYEKKLKIKKKSDNPQNNLTTEQYAFALSNIIELSIQLKMPENVKVYATKLEELSKKYCGENSCNHISILFQLAVANDDIGLIDNVCKYAQKIIDNCLVIDSCNYQYVNASYSYLTADYYQKNQMDLDIKTAIEQLNKLEAAPEPFTFEIIEALQYLLVCYTDDLDVAYEYGTRAETLLEKEIGSKEILYTLESYYNIISILAVNRFLSGDYVASLHYNVLCRDVLKFNNLTDTKEYYDVFNRLMECANNSGQYDLILSLSTEYESMIFTYSDEPINDAYTYSINLANAYGKLGMYEDVLRVYDDIINLSKMIGDDSAIRSSIIDVIYGKAQIYQMTGQDLNALDCLNEGISLIDSHKEDDYYALNKARFLSLEGLLTNDFNEALPKYDTALLLVQTDIDNLMHSYSLTDTDVFSLNLYDEQNDMDRINAIVLLKTMKNVYGEILLNKGMMIYNHGKTQDALPVFIEYASLVEKIKTQYSVEYVTALNNIALCQMYIGNYSYAINTLNKALNIIENHFGKNNPEYASIMLNFSLYYNVLGDYDKVIEYSKESARIGKDYGSSDVYINSIANIGTGYFLKHSYPEAETYLTEACKLMESLDRPTPNLGLIYQNLAMMYYEMDQDDKGDFYYEKAKALILQVYGKPSIEYAQLAGAMGWELYVKNNSKAYDEMLDAATTMISLGYTYHPTYIRALSQYGAMSVIFNKPLASDYPKIALEALKEYYKVNIAYYTSSDRMFFVDLVSFIKDIDYSTRYDSQNDVYLYDLCLFGKSLMLITFNKFRQAVYSTNNTEIIQQYEEIQTLKTKIDNLNFNQTVADKTNELFNQMTSLERALILKLTESGVYNADIDISYSDIVKRLKKNEIAVEFVDYYNKKDDKTYYIALLAKSSWDKPMYIPLCQDSDLNKCIGNPNMMYSSDELYQLLWKPLLQYIKKGDVVYFSPSGKLHTISIEALHTPDGSYLKDNYNLIRLTSTRELCVAKPTKAYKSSVIYGGLNYDVEQNRMKEVAQQYSTVSGDNIILSLRGDDRGNWNYLPGTKDEASQIAAIMLKSKIKYDIFENDLGNEESFKSLSDKDIDIIHLATHGFFIKTDLTDNNLFMINLSKKNDSIIDPMLRSGLILSGGNNAWLGNATSSDIEDGVLTALEISNMNLSNTDLVVLSACETGLGEITNDGVFGLQRAFKMAGVQTLVMSLWKVDDMATSLMMQTFYEQLLSGKSKRDAFNIAQNTVRNKYPEPYYWAAFIMLD